MASTSFVGRMPLAAGSVMNRPVVHPPTNTSSSRTGASRRTTDSKSTRFGSATKESPKTRAELSFRQLPFSHPSVAHGVDQREQFIQGRILPCRFHCRFVQWLERDAAHLPFG